RVVRRWQRPLVPPGPDELFLLWAQLVTGTSIDASEDLRALDAKTRQRYRERLQELGIALDSSPALVSDAGSNPCKRRGPRDGAEAVSTHPNADRIRTGLGAPGPRPSGGGHGLLVGGAAGGQTDAR